MQDPENLDSENDHVLRKWILLKVLKGKIISEYFDVIQII